MKLGLYMVVPLAFWLSSCAKVEEAKDMAEVADYNARAALIKIEQLRSDFENLKSENDDLTSKISSLESSISRLETGQDSLVSTFNSNVEITNKNLGIGR
jgi:hypothetical protein